MLATIAAPVITGRVTRRPVAIAVTITVSIAIAVSVAVPVAIIATTAIVAVVSLVLRLAMRLAMPAIVSVRDQRCTRQPQRQQGNQGQFFYCSIEKNMTGNTKEYIEYVLELLEPINAISSGKFFGGQGVSCNSVQFSMIMGNSLFFVVDDSTRDKYIDRGTECFWYMKKTGKVKVKKYHEVPGELLDEPSTLLEWARESIKIAKKSSKKKK